MFHYVFPLQKTNADLMARVSGQIVLSSQKYALSDDDQYPTDAAY